MCAIINATKLHNSEDAIIKSPEFRCSYRCNLTTVINNLYSVGNVHINVISFTNRFVNKLAETLLQLSGKYIYLSKLLKDVKIFTITVSFKNFKNRRYPDLLSNFLIKVKAHLIKLNVEMYPEDVPKGPQF